MQLLLWPSPFCFQWFVVLHPYIILPFLEIVLLLVDIYMYIINFTAHFSADLKLKPGSHLYALMMGS